MKTEKITPVLVRQCILEDILIKFLKNKNENYNDENFNKEKFINELFQDTVEKIVPKLLKDIDDGIYWDVKSERSRIEFLIIKNNDYENPEIHSRKFSEVFTENELNEFTKK